MIDVLDHFHSIDYFVFTFILVLTLIFIYWGNKLKDKSLNLTNISNDERERLNYLDYLVMGRQLTLPMFVATLVATWYGGILGVSEIAYNNGIYNFITQGVFWYVTYLIFALFIVDRISGYDSLSLADLVGKIWGTRARFVCAVFNIINVIPIVYVISLGLLIQFLFHVPIEFSMIIGLFFVTSYSMFGGLRAVVFSDLIQFVIMMVSVVFLYLFSVSKYGGMDFLTNHLGPKYFSLTSGHGILETFSWGLLALSTLVDPNFYQRCYAAKSFKVAKNGIFISTIVWIVFDLSLTFGALYAKVILPEANSKFAYLYYAIQTLPHGMKGLFIAGIFAIVLSTLDSYLFMASATMSFDLFKGKWAQKKGSIKFFTFLVALFSYFFAMIFDGNIKLVWKTLGSYSAGCLLTPVIVTILFKFKTSENAFLSSVAISIVTTTLWRFYGNTTVDSIYIGCLTSVLVLISFSRFKKLGNR